MATVGRWLLVLLFSSVSFLLCELYLLMVVADSDPDEGRARVIQPVQSAIRPARVPPLVRESSELGNLSRGDGR